jgi:hypothetical protein
MKKYLILLLIPLISFHLKAQKSLMETGAESITAAELRDHIYYLASDELEGRLSGTPGYDKAVQYAATQLFQAGLTPVSKNGDQKLSFYQQIPLDKYSPGTSNTITVSKVSDKQIFKFEENFIMIYGGPFDNKNISGELVFAGAGLTDKEHGIDDYKNIDAKGKWAVIYDQIPDTIKKRLPAETLEKYLYAPDNRKLLARNALDAGAIGLIKISPRSLIRSMKVYADGYHDFYTIPVIDQPWLSTGIPDVIIDSALVEYLFAGQKVNPLKRKAETKPFALQKCSLTLSKEYYHSSENTANAVGMIEGSDPVLKNEYIVVTAHLDHMGVRKGEVMNGAIDNASGSVGVLEIAEALAKTKPKRSVICVLCAGEELGLLGSWYFTHYPPVPLENIVANINLDMICMPDTSIKGIAPITSGKIPQKIRDIMTESNDTVSDIRLNWIVAGKSRFKNSSDHYPFYLQNIPAIFLFTGGSSDVHAPGDDAGKIDYDFYEKSCRSIYKIIYGLSNAEGSLKKIQ